MIRTQVQLEEAQYKKLRELGARQSKSVAQLVREAVQQLLGHAERGERWQLLWKAVGSCHDSEALRDVATRHDDYLNEIYRP